MWKHATSINKLWDVGRDTSETSVFIWVPAVFMSSKQCCVNQVRAFMGSGWTGNCDKHLLYPSHDILWKLGRLWPLAMQQHARTRLSLWDQEISDEIARWARWVCPVCAFRRKNLEAIKWCKRFEKSMFWKKTLMKIIALHCSLQCQPCNECFFC